MSFGLQINYMLYYYHLIIEVTCIGENPNNQCYYVINWVREDSICIIRGLAYLDKNITWLGDNGPRICFVDPKAIFETTRGEDIKDNQTK